MLLEEDMALTKEVFGRFVQERDSSIMGTRYDLFGFVKKISGK